MGRRAPATQEEYREVLKLLQAGRSQREIEDITGIPMGTVGKWPPKFQSLRIWDPTHKSVDWHVFEEWAEKKARRAKSPQESPHRPTPKSPRQPTPTTHTLTDDETQALKELVAWWKDRRTHAQSPQLPTPEGPRTRRHILVNDELWEHAKRKAKREEVSVGDLVTRALRAYLGRGYTLVGNDRGRPGAS